MSDTNKLDPASLTSEERAIVDHLFMLLYSNCGTETEEDRYGWALKKAEPIILARRKFFSIAPDLQEPAKVADERREPAPEQAIRILAKHLDNCAQGSAVATAVVEVLHWLGEPAQPEPAAPEMPDAVKWAIYQLRQNVRLWELHGEQPASETDRKTADALESWWRTHSQPQKVTHPFSAEFKPDSMRHFAEYVRDNWHYFGTDTAGLAHQFLQEQAEQQVKLEKAREFINYMGLYYHRKDSDPPYKAGTQGGAWQEALAELDAAEGRKP